MIRRNLANFKKVRSKKDRRSCPQPGTGPRTSPKGTPWRRSHHYPQIWTGWPNCPRTTDTTPSLDASIGTLNAQVECVELGVFCDVDEDGSFDAGAAVEEEFFGLDVDLYVFTFVICVPHGLIITNRITGN